MEVKVNIIDTLFTTIPKNTVVASYTIDEDSVDLTMLNDQYSFNTANKTILTSSNVTSNNLKAINFTVRNWVSGEQVEINDMYPRVVSKLQNKFNKPNTIYKVTKDLDLNHCVLTIPEGCTLQFDGGSISNDSLSGNFTKIIADSSTVIFGQQIHIEGSWDIADIYDEWFWFDTDPSYISNDTIKNILALSNDSINNTVHFDANRTYYFELPYKGRVNLGDDIRPDYWKLNTPDYDFLRIFTGVTSNTHLIVNNTLQMLPTNQGAYFIFQIENKENIEISGTGTINGDAKDHLYTDPFAGTSYYGEWGHVLNFRSCNNVVVRDITVGYAFGDGIACGNAAYDIDGVKTANPATTNVLIDGVKVLYARRNGISVGGNNYSITNVYFEGCGSDEIKGTAPMAAIDFENDYIDIDPSGICSNVVMSSCKFKDNKYDASSTIRDDLATIPAGELIVINDCNFTAPLRLNRTHGLTFNNCHIVGISSHDNSISAWYASSDLIFNCCVFDELNPYLAISAEEQGKKFVNPTYPEDIKYSTTFQHSLSSTKALKFTIPKPLVGLVEFTAFCSNPNYSAVQMPINTTEYTFGNSQRLTGIRDVKVRTIQDSTPRYAMYKNTPVFSYINYAEDADNFIIYFAIGGQILGDPLAGNTSVNIFVTSKTKFIVVKAPVSGDPDYAGIYGGKWSELSAIKKQSIDFTVIPSTVTFPSKEIYPASTMADLPTSLTPDKVNKSFFLLDSSYRLPAFWDSYDNTFRDADGNKILGRTVGLKADLDALAAKLTTSDRGYKVYYSSYATNLTWSGTEWLNVDGSRYETTRIIRDKASTLTWSQVLGFENLTYIIVGDIDLGGEELVLGNNTILDFQGGSFTNGSIVLNNTEIRNPKFSNISFSGSCLNNYYNIVDFGAIAGADEDVDNSVLINELVQLKGKGLSSSAKTIYIPQGRFNIKNPIKLYTTWDTPVVLCGTGRSSILRQTSANTYLIKAYEIQHIRDLSLIFATKAALEDTKSIAIAVNRSIFCRYQNLLIENAHTAFGYIKQADLDWSGAMSDSQVYVNSQFENIRIYHTRFYAFDFSKETGVNTGDSGSLYSNIYINSAKSDGTGYDDDNDTQQGAILINNTSNATFSQLNVEGKRYAATVIHVKGNSGLLIDTLHIEGLTTSMYVFQSSGNSCINVRYCDVQTATFSGSTYKMIYIVDAATIIIDSILFRGCKNDTGTTFYLAECGYRSATVVVNRLLDASGIVTYRYPEMITGNYKINSGVLDISTTTTSFAGNPTNFPKYKPIFNQSNNYVYYKGEEHIYYPDGFIFKKNGETAVRRKDGTTAQRPTLENTDAGFHFYDTTLKKYICWNGTAWTNFDGTALT